MKLLYLREEGIGNAILSLPVLASLCKNLPKAQVDVWVDPRAYDILENHPQIANLFKWPKVPTNGIYDFGIVALFNGGLMIEGARKICKKLLFHPKVDYVNKSETLHNFEIISQIGGWDGKYYSTSIFLSSENEKFGFRLVKDQQRPIICLHIGCQTSVSVHRKRFWRLEGWVQLVELLNRKYNPTFILLGGEGEIPESKQLLGLIKNKARVVDMVGKYKIKEGACILKNSDLLISIDSGIMHLCSVVGTKQIALFGPTSEIKSRIWCDENNYGIIRHPVSCERCYTRNPPLFQSCKRQICMEGIEAQNIVEEIQKRGFLENV